MQEVGAIRAVVDTSTTEPHQEDFNSEYQNVVLRKEFICYSLAPSLAVCINLRGNNMPGRSCGKIIGLLVLLFALSQVVSCGQKGKLTLPDEQPSSLASVSIFT